MACAVGNALPSFVKEEDEREEHQAEEEGDEEEEQILATRRDLQPAGPSTAGQECSVWTGTRAVEQSPCTEAVPRAAGRSPSTRAATRAAEQACKPDAEVLPDEMRRSMKRKRAAASLHTEAVAAAATAAHGTAEESKPAPDSKSRVTHRKRMQTERSVLVKDESPSPQNASLPLSRAHSQHKISDPAELIVISDSEEENAASTHSSETTPIAHTNANANANFAPAQALALDPTHTPTHTPMATHRTVTGTPQAPNTGSASDPIVIELTESEDDDQVSVSAQNQPKSWLGSPQNQSTFTPRQLRAALRKPNSESVLASPDDFFLSLSDNSPTPQNNPSTAKGCRAVQTSQAPFAQPLKGSLAPLSGSVKGSPCPLSQSMKVTPVTPQALPNVTPGKLKESIRSAARSQALLSVPRRGRTNGRTDGAVSPPPDSTAKPPDSMASSGNPPDSMATSGNPPVAMATSGRLHGTAFSCMHCVLAVESPVANVACSAFS